MSEPATNTDIVRKFEAEESQSRSEHISMDSGGTPNSDAEVTAAVDLKKICARYRFSNHMLGTRFSYELYEEGYLKVRKWEKKQLVEDYYLALRFLNPVARVTRVVARKAMYAAAGLFSATLVAGILYAITPYDQILRSSTILLACGSAISFMLFLYWSHERTYFFSSEGDCEVLKLMGSAESFRACRAIAPAISQAIEKAKSDNTRDRQMYLREEMHEHYRLQRAAVITSEACTAATRRILSQYE
jgi:hypothetical protein